jgi:hypothetical protein
MGNIIHRSHGDVPWFHIIRSTGFCASFLLVAHVLLVILFPCDVMGSLLLFAAVAVVMFNDSCKFQCPNHCISVRNIIY